MDKHLVEVIEEQIAVGFTGKINVLNSTNKQLLGNLIFSEGDFIHTVYKGLKGFKALSNLTVDEIENVALDYVVEPEVIGDVENTIFYPFSKLKVMLQHMLTEYHEVKDQRPPNELKLLINPSVLTKNTELSETEFKLLCTMSDVSLVKDIYQSSELLDYEITKSLVTLRKKNAIKVIGPNNKESSK